MASPSPSPSPAPASTSSLAALQDKIWKGRLPLEIRLSAQQCRTFDQSEAYFISVPRLSYLPALLPRLLRFFQPLLITPPDSPYSGHFTFASVPLKWHLPLGLLHDIYAYPSSSLPTEQNEQPSPFRLIVHFHPTDLSSKTLTPLSTAAHHDAFINNVKEADFLRSGTARPIMSLPKADSKALFQAVGGREVDDIDPNPEIAGGPSTGETQSEIDFPAWKRVMSQLLPRDGEIRNVPLRVYLPSSSSNAPSSNSPKASPTVEADPEQPQGQIRVLQLPLPPSIAPSSTSTTASRQPAQPQTLGTALNKLLPSLFPSRRVAVLARPVLHGAEVPMSARLEELGRWACYAEGWVGVVVVVN
ncbi:MAG: hypothetical protein Q9227_000635 [Pyrenula ochraceoflavens]